MSYAQVIHEVAGDAAKLEDVFHQAVNANEDSAFADAINTSFAENPDNLLYAAWYYRLAYAAQNVASKRTVAWLVALPLALATGLIFWWLSDIERYEITATSFDPLHTVRIPYFFLLWAPIAAIFVLVFLGVAGHRRWTLGATLAIALALAAIYPILAYRLLDNAILQEHYLTLMIFHLPLLAWVTIGLLLLVPARNADNRFAFLIKSLEVFILGGLFGIALAIFTGISFGLFEALGIQPSQLVVRLFIAGCGGLIPVLAVAILYDPPAAPAEQSFDDGLSKLIATLMRLLLPLTLLILAIYLGFIPFRFWEPFQNRDVLIAYNAMLFAVMALLVGATPVSTRDLGMRQQVWLRRGLIAVAVLATLVSAYAFAAIAYRTAQEGLTPNRLTFIGWNIINTGILLLLLFRQVRVKGDAWLPELKATFSIGCVGYAIWGLFVVLALPWLF